MVALKSAPNLFAHLGQNDFQAGAVAGILGDGGFGATLFAFTVGYHLAVVASTGVPIIEECPFAELVP